MVLGPDRPRRTLHAGEYAIDIDEVAQAGGDVLGSLGGKAAHVDIDNETVLDDITMKAQWHEAPLGEQLQHAGHHAGLRRREDRKTARMIGSKFSSRHDTQAPWETKKGRRCYGP